MTVAGNLGFPRIGRRRELKTALEQYWSGALDEPGLEAVATALRIGHWQLQVGLGISHVPCGDFSLYDHVLDTACMLGAIPPGYGWSGGPVSLATYFALARGSRDTAAERVAGIAPGLPAMEMTKWFDTNYHYLVPRLSAGQRFALSANRLLAQFREAMAMPVRTRPTLLGPVSFLMLAKMTDGSDPLDLLHAVLPIYNQVMNELAESGASWVQMDEPVLGLDLTEKAKVALGLAYGTFAAQSKPDILLTSYFGPLGGNLAVAARLHVDLVRGITELDAVVAAVPVERWLSLGIVDGRNVWRTDLLAALGTLQRVASVRGTRQLMLAPSCSLLHVPFDVAHEAKLDSDVKGWLAFAVQKLQEVALLVRGLDEGEAAVAAQLSDSDAAVHARRTSPRVHRTEVFNRVAGATADMERRSTAYSQRRLAQQARLQLPLFPTTTIGSFPQTAEVRRARASLARMETTETDYETVVKGWIDDVVRWQEELGLDVVVHGEFELNDMVKYFGEQLSGYAFTQHGWVQSYGSRCVAPPIIWGDDSRPAPMTVRWSAYAQSRTSLPMKGMPTGPVTMLQWSFVRDEVTDLEAAGIPVIQVDEPAFREGLPLRHADWQNYLRWAIACFRLSTSSVADATSIHTHMCYSQFNDIMPAIADMDADAISIETTRSRMGLLDAFGPTQDGSTGSYPAEIGPGIWDIHSPRVPGVTEMAELLCLARQRLEDWQIWVNPTAA